MAGVTSPAGGRPSAMRRTALMKKSTLSGLWLVTSGGAARSTSERSTVGSNRRQTAHSASAGPGGQQRRVGGVVAGPRMQLRRAPAGDRQRAPAGQEIGGDRR